jgi:hypothetical protein
MFDSLHAAIALGPLATYLLVLGVVNLGRRPHVTSGARDAAALTMAIAGLVVAGPMELFLVEEAAVSYGAWVWAMMLVAYALFALLLILLMRPRLVIYNVTVDQLRPILEQVARQLDPQTEWAGESLAMPRLEVQMHIDASPVTKNVQLVATGPQQSIHGWRQFEQELAAALQTSRTTPNPYGLSLLSFGVLMAATITFLLARDPSGAVHALNEMLRR